MYSLMSFVECMMEKRGLEEILRKAFGGVAKMLSRKKFPQKDDNRGDTFTSRDF
jgi:hypothetical protein